MDRESRNFALKKLCMPSFTDCNVQWFIKAGGKWGVGLIPKCKLLGLKRVVQIQLNYFVMKGIKCKIMELFHPACITYLLSRVVLTTVLYWKIWNTNYLETNSYSLFKSLLLFILNLIYFSPSFYDGVFIFTFANV